MNKNISLIRLLDIDQEFIIDLRYATSNNFTNQIIYDTQECFINHNTAKMLIKAKEIFKRDGYRVKVWDAYRPIWAQQRLWDIVQNPDFVAAPPKLSEIKVFKASHLNGMSVDITLTDMNGIEIEMPTAFDDFSERASASYDQINGKAYENARYMIRTMESIGFENYEKEWWHFYDRKNTPTIYLDYKLKDLQHMRG